MNSKQIVILVVVAVVFGGGGFFGGMKYQASKTPTMTIRGGGPGGTFAGRRGGPNGASFLNGQVASINGSTATIKLMNGGSQIVVLAPSTAYRKAVDGTAADMAVGSNVTITGTSNSDGSLTAQSVQIRSASSTMPGFGPGGGAQGNGTPGQPGQ